MLEQSARAGSAASRLLRDTVHSRTRNTHSSTDTLDSRHRQRGEWRAIERIYGNYVHSKGI